MLVGLRANGCERTSFILSATVVLGAKFLNILTPVVCDAHGESGVMKVSCNCHISGVNAT